MNKIIITQFNNIRFLLVYENETLVECHPMSEHNTLRIGSIYIGRVEKVVKNIQSAFIRLDKDNVGYLPLDEKPALVLNRKLPKGLPSIAENDLILVEVEQEAQKMKQARVTGNISLTGKYVALSMDEGLTGVSRKIKNQERVIELKKLLSEETYGCIFRTECEHADNQAILAEFEAFKAEMDAICHKAVFERKTGCIRQGKAEYISLMEEYGLSRIDEVKTDIPEIAETLKDMIENVVLYEDKEYPLYKLLNFESELDHIISKRVWLKSGGFLVIEPTEAMVVIDVNSGKAIGKKKKETHIFEMNLEAAKEITKQIRLRNLSGILMIDFINMDSVEYKKQIIKCLEEGLRKDKTPSFFVEVTKLDLFELTRKKVRKPIYEVILKRNGIISLKSEENRENM